MDTALAALQEGVVLLDAKSGQILFANDFFARMVGRERIFLLGQALQTVLPLSLRDADPQQAGLPWSPLQAEPPAGTWECMAQTPHGERMLEVSANSFDWAEDAGKNVRHLVLTLRDVTERRRDEEALRHSEVRARLLIQDVKGYAIFMLDPEGRVQSWNVGAERIKGYKAEEIVGRHFSLFYTPEDVRAGKPARELAVAAVEGRLEDEGWRVRKDGTRFWADIVITPVKDKAGGLLGYAKVTRDMTERRRDEEALRRNAELLRTLFEFLPDAIVLVRKNGEIARINEKAETLFGYGRDELLGRQIEVLLPQRFRQKHVQHRDGFVREPRLRAMGAGLDLYASAKDGREIPVDIMLGPLAVDGEPMVIAVVRDVTERKRTDKALRDYAENLDRTNRELEAFSSSVAHDLRAPLRGVDGFSQVLVERYADKLDDEGREFLRRVCAATRRMGRLIDDLLSLSRITRGGIRRERVDLSALAREIADELRRGAPRRTAEFLIQDGLSADGDPNLLRVALANLLDNAWKYTSKHPRSTIEFSAALRQGRQVYSVRDDGAGFDMRHAQKLFTPFGRLHSVREFEGSGIGLATVQRIIERHGGRVWGEGQVERGATFRFTLWEVGHGQESHPARGG